MVVRARFRLSVPNADYGSGAADDDEPLRRANEVIAYLKQREDDLMFQVEDMQRQLDASVSLTTQVRLLTMRCLKWLGGTLAFCVTLTRSQGDASLLGSLKVSQRQNKELIEQVCALIDV